MGVMAAMEDKPMTRLRTALHILFPNTLIAYCPTWDGSQELRVTIPRTDDPALTKEVVNVVAHWMMVQGVETGVVIRDREGQEIEMIERGWDDGS